MHEHGRDRKQTCTTITVANVERFKAHSGNHWHSFNLAQSVFMDILYPGDLYLDNAMLCTCNGRKSSHHNGVDFGFSQID